MDVTEAIHGRRSIRAYRAQPVEQTLIEDLTWAAVQAPTPPVSGDTPWAFCVIEGADRLTPRIRPVIHWCNSGTLRSELTVGHLDN